MLKAVIFYTSLVFLLSSCSVSNLFKSNSSRVSANKNIIVSADETPKANAVKSLQASASKPFKVSVNRQRSLSFNQTSQVPSQQTAKHLHLSAPFSLALESVETYIKYWLLRPSEVPLVRLNPPQRPALPKVAVLSKGEFENRKQFRTRLAQEKLTYQQTLDGLKQGYIDEVGIYNAAIKTYNSELQWEQKRRREQAKSMRIPLLNTAVNEVLGIPKLVNVLYDADREIFNAKVIAQNSAVSYDVLIPVAAINAQDFKKSSNEAIVAIKMNLKGQIKPVSFRIDNAQGSYVAYLENDELINMAIESEQRSSGVEDIDLSGIKINRAKVLKVGDSVNSNEEYFRSIY
jgi:uncharacterized protein YkuJ